MPTSAELLQSLEEEILKRQNGGAFNGYSIADRRWEGESLVDLYRIRAQLRAEVDIESGSGCKLYYPRNF